MSESGSVGRPVYNNTMYTRCPRPALGQAPGIVEAGFSDCQKPGQPETAAKASTDAVVKRKKRAQSPNGMKRKKERTSSRKGDRTWRHSSRSRRLIANARERSRIHIMSEAFEGLRRAVPSYSHDQKLSKLAILRLATSYISALADLTETDTSAKSLKHFADCVDECTRALQAEGRAKRREGKKYTSEDI